MTQIYHIGDKVLKISLLCTCLIHVWICDQVSGRHFAEIVQKPDDVIGSKCGEELRMTCMAKALGRSKSKSSSPDVEWWYRDHSVTSSPGKLVAMDRDGRIELRTEEFYVVRSTLIIRDAKTEDEGVYQCRASSSPNRYKENVNVYKYWKIEEAPINDVKCDEDATTAFSTTSSVHVIPTASYNRTKSDYIITSAMTSTTTQANRKPDSSITSRNPRRQYGVHETVNYNLCRTFIKRYSRRTTASTNSNGRGSGLSLRQNRCQHVAVGLIMTFIFHLLS